MNSPLADNSHEISILIWFPKAGRKFESCLLQIYGGSLRANTQSLHQ